MDNAVGLLSVQELLSLPPRKWLLQDIIPERGLVCLYGPSGTMKSFVALAWAACIAQGKPWLGHECQHAPVVYVAAEGTSGYAKRVQALMQHHEVKDFPGLYFKLSPVMLTNEDSAMAFFEDIDAFLSEESGAVELVPGLLIIDTFAQSFQGDENDTQDISEFVRQMTKIANVRNMAILVVHHTNKGGDEERGNTAFRGGLDMMFRCKAHRGKTGAQHIHTIQLQNKKNKDAEELAPIFLSVAKVGQSIVLEACESPILAEEKAPTDRIPTKQTMLAYLKGAGEGLRWSEWQRGAGVPKDLFRSRLRTFIATHEIYQTSDGKYLPMPAIEDLAEEGEANED